MRLSPSPVYRLSVAVLIAALVCGTARVAAAQESADDTAAFEAELFGTGPDTGSGTEPESTAAADAVAARTDSAEVAGIEYLAGGTVVVQAAGSVPGGFDEVTLSSSAAGKLFAKVSVPDYGALYIAYNASHAFFQAYSGEGAAPPGASPYKPSFGLAELHYSFDLGKVLFIRVGNQLIAWGPSRIWSAVDFINLERSDAFASVDLRVGKPGLRLHLPLKRANAFLFGDFSGLVTESTGVWTIGDPMETINVGGRFDFTAGPFEFGLTGYGGKNAQVRAGADASGRLLGTTVYAEVAVAPPYSTFDTRVQASLGLSRAFGDRKLWSLSAEGFYNSSGRDLGGYSATDIMALPAAERVPLYQGKFYAYASLRADELFSRSLSTTLSVISNLSDLSYSIRLAESLSFARAVPITVSLAFAGGGADKEFTRFAGDASLSLTVTTRLEF
jgi:hypothetical protein